jgi:2-keto-4-pentenoate hydratase/2-oxohepta-3-ene-1,7-dioic acid hydratase in catechol pathway
MRLIHFADDHGAPRLGARTGADTFIDLTALGLPSTLDALLRDGEAGLAAARSGVQRGGPARTLSAVRLLPPVLQPAKAFAIGLNYKDHAAESQFDAPMNPVVFQRYPSSWVAHGQPIVRPHISTQFDYEAEVVAVIGKAGRYIRKEDALSHVAGYSLFNDGSVRDWQKRSGQWLLGKNFDASGGFGPEFVTADELPPGASGLRLQCRLNGQVVQDANTADMIFDVATLVAECSQAMALAPGDIIITGTPSGVGLARTPPLWMRAGDVCEIELEGLGILRNTVVDET